MPIALAAACAAGDAIGSDGSVPSSDARQLAPYPPDAVPLVKVAIALDKRPRSRRAMPRHASPPASKPAEAVSASGEPTPPPRGGVLVDIGSMGDKTSRSSRMSALMETTINQTFETRAPGMTTTWPGGGRPTRAQLARRGMRGFHVGGTLTSLTATPNGTETIVACTLSMFLATYPEKSMLAFAEGGAKVQATASDREIGLAKLDCVTAAAAELVRKRIIPTIRRHD